MQIDAAGTSAPSNAITVYEVQTPTITNEAGTLEEVSTVNLSYAQFQSLVAQGLQVKLPAGTQALQFTDGLYEVGNQSITTGGSNAIDLTNSIGDTLNLSGSSVVKLGAGADTINVLGGADTILASAGDAYATINQSGSGAVLFYGGDAPIQAVACDTGSTGGATLVGGANNVLIYQDAQAGTGAMFVAGSGNETLFGAASGSNDQYWGSFSGGSDMMFAGSGTDILVTSGGAQTLAGGAGTDVFYLLNPNAVGALTGTTPTPGRYTIFNAHPGDTIALTGYDSLYGAAGSHAAAVAVSSALASGSTTITLADGSTISFIGSPKGLTVASS